MNKKYEAISELFNVVAASRVEQSRTDRSESLTPEEDAFEQLLSLGELLDRLTIVNIKLYNLKDDVMKHVDDKDFRAFAAEQDVHLVRERARLKRCIDEKLQKEMDRIITEGKSSYNKEIKKYGN